MLEVIVQDNVSGLAYDISELTTRVDWSTYLTNQPGKLTFSYLDDGKTTIGEGSIVVVRYGGIGLFYGYVFKRSLTHDAIYTVTCYDQMRYLKNKDTYIITGATASQTFERICKDYQLTYNVINPSTYVTSPYPHENKELFSIMERSINETIIHTGNFYMVRDNFGTLEFVNVNTLKTNLYIGDESLATSFRFDSSIDEDTYNKVKMVKENKETLKREVYIVRDPGSISRFGTLQYFEEVDEKANAEQIRIKAERILALKNRVTKRLKLNAIGEPTLRAGSGIVLGISRLEKEALGIDRYYIITGCTHTFQGIEHTMELELRVSI